MPRSMNDWCLIDTVSWSLVNRCRVQISKNNLFLSDPPEHDSKLAIIFIKRVETTKMLLAKIVLNSAKGWWNTFWIFSWYIQYSTTVEYFVFKTGLAILIKILTCSLLFGIPSVSKQFVHVCQGNCIFNLHYLLLQCLGRGPRCPSTSTPILHPYMIVFNNQGIVTGRYSACGRQLQAETLHSAKNRFQLFI